MPRKIPSAQATLFVAPQVCGVLPWSYPRWGRVLTIAGSALWTVRYFTSGSSSFLDWPSYSPHCDFRVSSKRQAEAGLLMTFVGQMPRSSRVGRSRAPPSPARGIGYKDMSPRCWNRGQSRPLYRQANRTEESARHEVNLLSATIIHPPSTERCAYLRFALIVVTLALAPIEAHAWGLISPSESQIAFSAMQNARRTADRVRSVREVPSVGILSLLAAVLWGARAIRISAFAIPKCRRHRQASAGPLSQSSYTQGAGRARHTHWDCGGRACFVHRVAEDLCSPVIGRKAVAAVSFPVLRLTL